MNPYEFRNYIYHLITKEDFMPYESHIVPAPIRTPSVDLYMGSSVALTKHGEDLRAYITAIQDALNEANRRLADQPRLINQERMHARLAERAAVRLEYAKHLTLVGKPSGYYWYNNALNTLEPAKMPPKDPPTTTMHARMDAAAQAIMEAKGFISPYSLAPGAVVQY